MKNFLGKAFIIGGVVQYLWTLAIAVYAAGFIGLLITAFLPVLSSVYWFFGYGFSQSFLTLYHVYTAGYTITAVVLAIIGAASKDSGTE